MIDPHPSATPNGWKVSILLKKLGMPCIMHPVSLSMGEQKAPVCLNPNGSGKDVKKVAQSTLVTGVRHNE
jgi:glutathione S-transferase